MAFESLTERLQNVLKICVVREKFLRVIFRKQLRKFVWPY